MKKNSFLTNLKLYKYGEAVINDIVMRAFQQQAVKSVSQKKTYS
jgi:hypothetical protein